jgi:hypothetical protein
MNTTSLQNHQASSQSARIYPYNLHVTTRDSYSCKQNEQISTLQKPVRLSTIWSKIDTIKNTQQIIAEQTPLNWKFAHKPIASRWGSVHKTGGLRRQP